jgi:biotin-(acetyl-CoA carboxylase) ligase
VGSDLNDPLLVVGVGLNRQVEFPAPSGVSSPITQGALTAPISLSQVTPQVPSEIALLTKLRHYFLQAVSHLNHHPQGFAALLPALRQRDGLQGQQITLALGEQTLTGTAAGLDDQGWLRLRLDAQTCLAFGQGRVVAWAKDSGSQAAETEDAVTGS